jgi:hypothetical protein
VHKAPHARIQVSCRAAVRSNIASACLTALMKAQGSVRTSVVLSNALHVNMPRAQCAHSSEAAGCSSESLTFEIAMGISFLSSCPDSPSFMGLTCFVRMLTPSTTTLPFLASMLSNLPVVPCGKRVGEKGDQPIGVERARGEVKVHQASTPCRHPQSR